MPAHFEPGSPLMIDASAPAIEARLKETIAFLTEEVGPRSFRDVERLRQSADYIKKAFLDAGYATRFETYDANGLMADNVVAERRGSRRPDDILVFGAHYDTVEDSPGADDNASGVAVLLELARLVAARNFNHTVRFAAFTLEEPPYFRTEFMGSRVHARQAKEAGERIRAMVCLESVGVFTDEPGSQSFPMPFLQYMYPNTGNFITVVSNIHSRKLAQAVTLSLRRGKRLPVEKFSGPGMISGVDWSDHASFWEEGYSAVMLTDTAPYRNPNYHLRSDRYAGLNFSRMVDLAESMQDVFEDLDAVEK